jgi:hypothetical protein
MVLRSMIDAAGCRAPLSLTGGALAGAAQDLVAHCAMGLPGGVALGGGVGGGGGGAGFAAQPPPPSCRAEYARITFGWTPDVMDQDLLRSEAWLGNRWHLAGMITGLLLLARRHRPIFAVVARGSILLGHGVAPRGPRYADHLEGWMNLAPMIVRGCGLWCVGGAGEYGKNDNSTI